MILASANTATSLFLARLPICLCPFHAYAFAAEPSRRSSHTDGRHMPLARAAPAIK